MDAKTDTFICRDCRCPIVLPDVVSSANERCIPCQVEFRIAEANYKASINNEPSA